MQGQNKALPPAGYNEFWFLKPGKPLLFSHHLIAHPLLIKIILFANLMIMNYTIEYFHTRVKEEKMPDLKYKPVTHNHETFLKKAMKKKEFKEAYKELDEKYALIRELQTARSHSGMTQEAVAESMGTTKSAVSRLETGEKHTPSLTTLKRYAQAVGCRVEIKLVPDPCLTPKSNSYAGKATKQK